MKTYNTIIVLRKKQALINVTLKIKVISMDYVLEIAIWLINRWQTTAIILI